jgi:hypothetical protein
MTTLSLVGTDARRTNWKFLLPATSAPELVLEDGDLPLPGVRCSGTVVAPDLGCWAPRVPAGPALGRLCDLVPAGGWLLVGFGRPTPWTHRAGHTGLSLRRAIRTARTHGLVVVECYGALPDQRRAAVLVPVRHRGELDDLLRRVPVTYVSRAAGLPRARRRLRQLARVCAMAGPHRPRVALLPGYFVLARRPS